MAGILYIGIYPAGTEVEWVTDDGEFRSMPLDMCPPRLKEIVGNVRRIFEAGDWPYPPNIPDETVSLRVGEA